MHACMFPCFMHTGQQNGPQGTRQHPRPIAQNSSSNNTLHGMPPLHPYGSPHNFPMPPVHHSSAQPTPMRGHSPLHLANSQRRTTAPSPQPAPLVDEFLIDFDADDGDTQPAHTVSEHNLSVVHDKPGQNARTASLHRSSTEPFSSLMPSQNHVQQGQHSNGHALTSPLLILSASSPQQGAAARGQLPTSTSVDRVSSPLSTRCTWQP